MFCAVQDVPFQTAPPPVPTEPTASQKVAETHDTERMEPGMTCRAQDVPFHISANGGLLPVASQNVGDTHETPVSRTMNWPLGLGAACALQDVPFQTSASGNSPEPLSETPTASQNVADVHDTANSAADVEPAGLGTDWIFHEVPFQTSARMIPVGPFW